MAEFEETRFFKMKSDKEDETKDIIVKVYTALREKDTILSARLPGICFQVTQHTLQAITMPGVWYAK